MRFESPYPPLKLPAREVSLPTFALGADLPSTTGALFLPPDEDTVFHVTRPRAKAVGPSEMREHAHSVAYGLASGKLLKDGKPLRKGDVVAVISANQVDYVANVLGIQLAGGVAALINPGYRPREVAHALRITGACAVLASSARDVTKAEGDPEGAFTSEGVAKEAISSMVADGELAAELPLLVFEEEAPNSWDSVCHTTPCELPSITGPDPAILCFSSGTTGLPKAVELSHANLIANMIGCAESVLGDRFNSAARSDEFHVDILPQFHCYGFMMNLIALYTVSLLLTFNGVCS